MFNEIVFIDWLHEQEWQTFLEFLNLNENELSAATDSNNRHLANLLGVDYNWYGLAIQKAKSYIQGQDILSVVNDVIAEITEALNDKNSNLSKGVEQIKTLPKEQQTTQMTKYIATAMTLRARRFAQRYHDKMSKMTVNLGAMSDKNQAENPNFIVEPRPHYEIEEIKQAIIEELKKMANSANDPRTKKRLELAAEIAPIRMENAPHMVPIGDLLSQYHDVAKTTMHNIIADIQNAFAKVAENMGMEGISGSIERIKNRKAV